MRSTPLQPRSSQRIAQFLEVAAALIAEVGYENLTMTAVAEGAGASIGALYRWFPDKTSLAQELRRQYTRELDGLLAHLVQDAQTMSIDWFSAALVDRTVAFTNERPAWLPLLDSTLRPVRDPAARKTLRDDFARTFRAYDLALSEERALIIANVALGIVKGLLSSFRNAPEEDREGFTAEFKLALTLYLKQALSSESP